jgi:hypothetical protein
LTLPPTIKHRALRIGCAIIVAGLLALSGCGTAGDGSGGLASIGGGRVLLTVDFQQGRTIRYKFVSSRKIAVDWDPNLETQANRVQELSEELEMVVAYTPVEVDPYGVSTIRAVCESVKATRTGGPNRRVFGTDATQTAEGKSFIIKVDPRGKVVDRSELKSLIQEMGKSAFRQSSEPRRIKEPDMIGDFVAGQWFLWDAVSSIEPPSQGVRPGQTWRSQLPVPTPMVMRKARDVTYRLDEVRRTDGARIAVIESTYTLAEKAPSAWPVPYSGRFQMSGTFGFLGSYEVSDLKGRGQELFNLDAGRVESYRQEYTMQVKATLPPMGIRTNPSIRIDQTLTMERQ